ncbi:hypothetical protein PINS_up000957 [Pythium insidiosum]|nr:hypothetical protein PINS_up000957 [Pythium insidiosum]
MHSLFHFPRRCAVTASRCSTLKIMSTKTQERDMSDWYRQVMESPPKCLEYVKQNAVQGDPRSVLDAIEAFALKNPMMNVGPRKGEVVDNAIRNKAPRTMVELGAYTGYSTVRFASVQREVVGSENSHYYSFEFSPEFAEIVREMVAFAGLSNQVTVITGAFADRFKDVLAGKTVDMYFIDHEKSCYLPDAKLMIESGTLAKGSLLVADNVLRPGAPDYLEYIQNHSQFSSQLHEVELTYHGNTWVDGVLIAEYKA